MFESRKTNALRGSAFRDLYLSRSVIDIGCGPDLVVPHAVPFDLADGDANRILDYHKPDSFDCVHSSHCLEHMRDVPAALVQWWALVKPGGHLIVVVPHEDLYEQGVWPSLFNADHKATFRLDKQHSWSPKSYDVRRLATGLPNCAIVDIAVQDAGYDYGLMRSPLRRAIGLKLLGVIWRCRVALDYMQRKGLAVDWLGRSLDAAERFAKPLDQTMGEALAQIQFVLRKTEEAPPVITRLAG
jgi:SAM-dependent methyltransferase